MADSGRGGGAVSRGKGTPRARSPGTGRAPAGSGGPEKVGELLGGFLEKVGLREAVLRAEVVEEWRERVGEAIGKVTRAQGVRDTTLIVEVRSSGWLMELNLMKDEILRKVNEDREEGLIERIVFVLAEQ
jgi:predicted nucleic acid-binding Zn ribbon protein